MYISIGNMIPVDATALRDRMLVAAIMAKSPLHLYAKDKQHRFIALSQSLADRLGCTVDQALGKTDFHFFDEAEARIFWEAEETVMRTGETLDRVVHHTWPDGRETWVINTTMALEAIGVFGTNTDITATKLLERELEKSQAQLREMSRKAGRAEVANNVLHNIGNVLNSVVVSAGLIGGKVRDSKSHGLAKAVHLINEHAANLGDFFTRDEKGKVLPGYLNKLVAALANERHSVTAELESLTNGVEHIKEIVATQQKHSGATNVVEPVQIRDLMEDALRMNSASLQPHQITVTKEFGDVPLLLLDKHLVLQTLLNLISNAKHATDGVPDRPHHITLRLGISASDDGPWLEIGVEDDGQGIAPDVLPRLFTHGFTTRTNGHGFGLHSCALAAREMGGSIAAHSDGPGRGAVFTVKLPLNPVKDL